VTPLEIINKLRGFTPEYEGHDAEFSGLLDELEEELGVKYLPQQTFDAAEELFGGSIFNPESRTYRSLSRRAQHALRVWSERYGPFNQSQAEYADSVLAAALRSAARDAAGDRSKLFRFAQARIGGMVNHETVHAGFLKRAQTFDVSEQLAVVA
jgi:hypothetical protein